MLNKLIQIHLTQIPICSDKCLNKGGRSLRCFREARQCACPVLKEFPICFCSPSSTHIVLDGPLCRCSNYCVVYLFKHFLSLFFLSSVKIIWLGNEQFEFLQDADIIGVISNIVSLEDS